MTKAPATPKSRPIYLCVNCGKFVYASPHRIEGLGVVGPDCFAGLKAEGSIHQRTDGLWTADIEDNEDNEDNESFNVGGRANDEEAAE